MGNRAGKTSSGATSQENQSVDRDLVSRPAGETSSDQAHARVQAHCIEVHISQITEAYVLVPSEAMEGERPQESGTIPSFAGTRILGEASLAPELADSTVETVVRTDAQPPGLDLLVEVCHFHLPEGSPGPSPKTVSGDGLAAELASVVPLPTGIDESRKGTEHHRPSTDLSYGAAVPESDQEVPCEVDVEFTPDKAQEAAEEETTIQRELDEAASDGALQRMAEPQPNLIGAGSPDRRPVITAAPGSEQLAEGPSNTRNAPPLAMEAEMPRERSAAVSWKEREGPCSPNEVSEGAEFQNGQKASCETRLKLAADPSQAAVEEPKTVQRQLGEEPSSEKETGAGFHPDLESVEASGGPSGTGTTLGTKQLPEEWSAPGHDLLEAMSEVEEVSGDGSAPENPGEITKAGVCHLKMLPVEAQDKILTQGETRDETACPVASKAPPEKDLEHRLTTQGLSTVEESPYSDVLLLGGVESLDASQPDGASSTLEVTEPEAQTAVRAPEEVTMTQSSSKALPETAGPRKEREEACPDQPFAEVTVAETGNPEAPRPALPGSTLQAVHGEEEGELVAVTASPGAAEIQA